MRDLIFLAWYSIVVQVLVYRQSRTWHRRIQLRYMNVYSTYSCTHTHVVHIQKINKYVNVNSRLKTRSTMHRQRSSQYGCTCTMYVQYTYTCSTHDTYIHIRLIIHVPHTCMYVVCHVQYVHTCTCTTCMQYTQCLLE